MMKKHVLAAAVSALVLGSASSCLAAANPFSDVPKDHWAYDAVTQLAKDGVIEGYGNGTFQGSKNITRYEMAQMVAKAMAKNDVSAADKAMIDKLAAEFADELNNLGVRVANLEKHADNVKWSGVFAQKAMEGNHENSTWWEKELFLNVDGQVNDDWKVHAGIDTKWGTNDKGFNGEEEFSDAYGASNHKVSNMLYHVYAQGPLFKGSNFTFGLFTPGLQSGYVGNARVKGAELDYKVGKTSIKAYGGRVNEKVGDLSSNWSGYFRRGGGIGDYKTGQDTETGFDDRGLYAWGASVEHAFTDKTAAGLGYYQLKHSYAYDNGSSSLGLWAVDFRQNLAKNLDLTAFYSHGNQHFQNKAYDVKLTYNGSPWGSKPWGAALGYRYLGSDALIMSSVVNGSEKPGMKGLEAQLWFHLAKNIQLQNYFFNGSPIDSFYNDSNNGAISGSRQKYHRTAYFSSLIFAF